MVNYCTHQMRVRAMHLVIESYAPDEGKLHNLLGKLSTQVRESNENGEVELSTWLGRATHLVRVSYASC